MKYTMKQVAKMLDMTEHTIRYYTDLEPFPCKQDNGNRRVFDQEAINWLIGSELHPTSISGGFLVNIPIGTSLPKL